ncbi:MAG: ATP-binding cassette domain-containing protein [Alphaproteobacteria bacterium]|nr:ATP-binding cassette domain-containing protein [Alphaproteobacteria bacterium]
MTHNAITLEDVCVRYAQRDAIHDVSGIFAEGTLTAIAGPNGAGKSTLLKAMAGIVKPYRGRVTIDPCFTNSVAYLPQAASVRRDMPMPVLQAVCTGFWGVAGERGCIDAAMKAKAAMALADVGLEGYENRQLGELSGGEFQRVMFARLILQDARILLLDEPFASFDGATTAKLIQIILRWHKEGRTIICVLHDLLLIRKYFPESFVLAGKCMGRGHTHDMFEQKLLSYDLDMAELHTGIDNHRQLHHHDHL